MNIQVISKKTFRSVNNVVFSDLSKPKSLDMFDINFIDLSADSIWYNDCDSYHSINCINDFKSIRTMVENSKNSKIIFVLPKNHSLNYSEYSGRYFKNIKLKDMLSTLVKEILSNIIPKDFMDFSLVFEITNTTFSETEYGADFYIESNYDAKTDSDKSKKITTVINKDRFLLTTLDVLKDEQSMWKYVSHLLPRKNEFPKWLEEYNFYTDEENKKEIEEKNKEIEALNKKIEKTKIKLEENLKYKSILSTNGDALVSVVLEIMGKLLSYDFSDFIDEKKEDFLCKLSDVTFVGEIKGVTSNVKNEHISQVDVHCQGYFDKLSDEGITENIKSLLIINPFRTKSLNEREDVHEIQIKLAERNGCLIITTLTLLKLFEKFLNDEISSERIVELFKSKTGLLLEDDLKIIKSQNVDNSVYKI